MDMAKDKNNQEIIGLLNRQKAVSNPNVSHVRKALVQSFCLSSDISKQQDIFKGKNLEMCHGFLSCQWEFYIIKKFDLLKILSLLGEKDIGV